MFVDLSKVYGLVAVHMFRDSQFQAIENMSEHMPHVVYITCRPLVDT